MNEFFYESMFFIGLLLLLIAQLTGKTTDPVEYGYFSGYTVDGSNLIIAALVMLGLAGLSLIYKILYTTSLIYSEQIKTVQKGYKKGKKRAQKRA